MTAQEIFDAVVRHLRAQGKPAVDPNVPQLCLYRAPDGNKCAFGILIPDDKYNLSMEGQKAFMIIDEGLPEFKAYVRFIDDLQAAHDHWACALAEECPFDLETRFASIAQDYNLVMPQ